MTWKPRFTNHFDRGLVEQIIAVRDRNGWAPTEVAPPGAAAIRRDNLCARLMCVVAELHEFCTARSVAARDEELADVAMYLLVMLYDLYEGKPHVVRSYRSLNFHDSLEEHAARVRSYAVHAFESWRRPAREKREADVRIALELALLEVCKVADVLDVDLDAEILAKVTKLYQRAPRHGGKHPDT